MPVFFTQILIGIALSVLAYVLMPKPPAVEPPEIKDLDAPVAEAGLHMPVVFGTQRVKMLNVLAFTDLRRREKEISA